MRAISFSYLRVVIFAAFSVSADFALAQLLTEVKALKVGFHGGPIVFTRDGKTLISSGTTSQIMSLQFWDTATFLSLKQFEPGKSVYAMAISPDGKTLALGNSDRVVTLWDLATLKPNGMRLEHAPQLAADQVCTVAFSPDGKLLASGSDNLRAMLWDLSSGKNLWTTEKHDDTVKEVTFSPDGKLLATVSYEAIRVWDVPSGKKIASIADSGNLLSVAYSPDGKLMCSCGTKTYKEVASLEGHTRFVLRVTFSPDGKLIASGGMDGQLKIWDVATRKELANVKAHGPDVPNVVFSPDGKMLATEGGFGSVKLWKIDSEAKN